VIDGWLFDAYPDGEGIRLWVVTPEGENRTCVDPWSPCFYVAGGPFPLERALKDKRFPVLCRRVEREEIFSGRALSVVEVRVPPVRLSPLVKELKDLGFTLYNGDVHPVQAYFYERGLFPLARAEFSAEEGRLRDFTVRDDPWALDYPLPPLRTVHMSLTGSTVSGALNPNHAARGALSLLHEGREYEVEGPPEEQLETLHRRLAEWDPDVITSDWGDSHLLPRLSLWSRRLGRPLDFSRDPVRALGGRAARSFLSFGKYIHQTSTSHLFGRWHIDLKNSFYFRECGLDGLFELARTAKIPVQRAARSTIGTSLTSMQMDRAWQRGVLVPMDKQQVEDPRPASALLAADKGGLIYEPEVGWYEDVAEYDFVSMYPTVMVNRNISPETVNCHCCPGNKVPEAGHHLCTRRRGLVPETLAPVLEKRARYKALARAGHPNKKSYKARSDVFKWALVTCFGYLGFKNARFGKIEAHECVNAWGRETWLRAKEAVEARGLHVIHGLVDSLWVQGKGGTDYEGLRQEIEARAECPVGLEGVYKWLRFCPSKRDPLAGIPNRYFGAFTTGETKARGLAYRRHDTPPLLRDMQVEMIRTLAGAGTLAACRAKGEELQAVVEEVRARLREGRVTPSELSIGFQLSKEPGAYVHDTLSALAAKRLAAAGVQLHPGEFVQYVIASADDKVKEWRAHPLALMEDGWTYDQKRYLELTDRAAEEILQGLCLAPSPLEGEGRAEGLNIRMSKKEPSYAQSLFRFSFDRPSPLPRLPPADAPARLRA
jgi:DNA polymerase elongation subunit (family B)